MTEERNGITKTLANFCCSLKYQDIPEGTVNRAKQCILDYLAATLPGSQTKTGKIGLEISKELNHGGPKHSTILGYGVKTNCSLAALANGMAGHALEIDDATRYATGLHPGVTVIPASLAIGEYLQNSGKELLTAIILGYEIAGRVGTAINPSHRYRGFHSTGTVASFGAAAAVAKLLGFDETYTAYTLGIAGAQAGGVFEFLKENATTKHLHAGRAAQNGVLAGLLAKKGMTGPTTILEGSEGFCKAYSDEYDIDYLTRDLGKKYEMDLGYFKLHSACGQNFSAIEAGINIKAKYEISYSEIEEIEISTYKAAAVLNNCNPQTVQEAQFSMPFLVALAMTEGEVSLRTLTPERINNVEIQSLASKVKVKEDKELTNNYPRLRTAVVKIKLADGNTIEEKVDIPRGMPEKPLTQKEVEDKFLASTSGVLDEGAAQAIIEKVISIDKAKNICDLIRLTNIAG